MKSFTRRSLTTIALGLSITAAAIAAQLPSECRNIESSMYPPPADLVAYCRQFVPPQEGTIVNFPSDFADGVDGSRETCASMILNAPELVTPVGSLPFRPSCDYANNDFSKLYCLNAEVPSVLSTVDPSTCVETIVGTASNATTFFSGMAWDVTTDTMFATTATELFTIDLASGASTLIGVIAGLPGQLFAIGVNPNGDLYGYSTSDVLLRIDKTTAAATTIGPIGFDAEFAQGMDFDHSDGTCYLFAFNFDTFQAELRTCDTATGATTLIGLIGSTTPGGQNDWTGVGIRTAEGMAIIFTDGFESGDTSVWSSSTP